MAWALGVAGCTEARAPLVRVEVVDRSGGPRGAGVVEVVEPALDRLAEGLAGFERRPARSGELGFQLRGEVRLVTERASPEPGRVHRAVGVTVRLWALDRSLELEANGLASGAVRPDAGFASLGAQAVEQASARLDAALALREASADEVVRALGSEDDALRNAALRAAGSRRLEVAVEPIGDLLRSDTVPTSVKLDAIGVLVEIGEPSAVGPIIETVEAQPPEFWPQILFAVAELGGQRAEGFLFTVAKGHDDPRVRSAAEDALRELEGRKAKSTP